MANIYKEDNLEPKLNSNKMRKRLLLTGMMFWVISNFHAQAYNNKVGINTNTPSATLDIVSKGSTSATKALEINSSANTEMITVLDNGQVGINQAAPATSALLELNSTNKSLLLTRVTNATDVTVPVNGMMVYDITLKCVRAYENAIWSPCLSSAGTTTTADYPPASSGAKVCNSSFVNPITMGRNWARGYINSTNGIITDRLIFLNTAGNAFYVQSNNTFYDIDVNNLLTNAGLGTTVPNTNANANYRFPVNTSIPNSFGVWKEIKAISQLFPTTTWKNFSSFTSGITTSNLHNWILLHSTTGELKAFHYSSIGDKGVHPYAAITGKEGIGKTVAALALPDHDPLKFFVYTDIKAYASTSASTASPTNWSWFEPYASFSVGVGASANQGVLAYNSADNLYYTWGGLYVAGSQTAVNNVVPLVLLRSNPASVAESMTPLPATLLNNLTTALGSKIKEPTDTHRTFIIQKATGTNSHLDFITEDNRIIRYLLNTGNATGNGSYVALSMPTGVTPLSLTTAMMDDGSGDWRRLYILGSDGKIYYISTVPTAPAQTGTIASTDTANPYFNTTTFDKVKQVTSVGVEKSITSIMFLTEAGKLGSLFNLAANAPVLTYPLPNQNPNGNIGKLFFAEDVDFTNTTNYRYKAYGTDKSGNNNLLIYDGNTTLNTSVANTGNNYITNYVADKIGNYIYSATAGPGTFENNFLLIKEYMPSKCVSY